jgi:hypothetical protein
MTGIIDGVGGGASPGVSARCVTTDGGDSAGNESVVARACRALRGKDTAWMDLSQEAMRPTPRARATACVRDVTSSFSKMLPT